MGIVTPPPEEEGPKEELTAPDPDRIATADLDTLFPRAL
jgi:hypothetical protein